MKEILNVFTGEVKLADASSELVSHAIGSCIVITAYLPETALGAMAHIMLPGKAPEKKQVDRLKYAEDALEELLLILHITEDQYPNLKICLIGGGNVLKRENDLICRKNIASVLGILEDKQLKVSARSLGGTMRRSVRFNVGEAEVYYKEDGSEEMLLWRIEN